MKARPFAMALFAVGIPFLAAPGQSAAQLALELRPGAAIGQGDTKDATDTGFNGSISAIAPLGKVLALGARGGWARLPLKDSDGNLETFLVAPEFRMGLLDPTEPLTVYASVAPGYVRTEGRAGGIPGLSSGRRKDDSFGFQAGGAMLVRVAPAARVGFYLDYHRSDFHDDDVEFLAPGAVFSVGF